MARLILFTAEGQQAIELRPTNSLGRAAGNTIQFLDKLVSKKHCVIALREIPRRPRRADMRARTFRGHGLLFSLKDLGSANGTYLNGERIRDEQFLFHGDDIRIGSIRARFDDSSGIPRPLPPVSIGATQSAAPLTVVSSSPQRPRAPSKDSPLITLSKNIDAPSCTACANRRPWNETIAAIEAKRKAHRVKWPNFVIMHGKDLTCSAATSGSGMKDRGLYVIATDQHGVAATHAKVFCRKHGWFVGVRSVLNDAAFE